MKDRDAVRLLREASLVAPSRGTEEAIRAAIRGEAQVATAEVFDLEGLAAFLRVEVEDVRRCLDEIPCFEVAGKLRFRRESVERWIDERERAYRASRSSSRMRLSAG